MNPKKKPMKILILITRLNIGGPAVQAVTLAKELSGSLFETTLVCGSPSAGEGDMSYIANAMSVKPLYIHDLGREISPLNDLKALIAIVRLLMDLRPYIVHTHMSKAGTLGRIAVFLVNTIRLNGEKIRIVHTFHGHTFHSYFSKFQTFIVKTIEKVLSLFTDQIVAISPLQKEDICRRYQIAAERKVSVIPLGFDLSRFGKPEDQRNGFLQTCFQETSGDAFLAGIVGRLTPVKNPQMLLSVAKIIKETVKGDTFRFLIVGDGEVKPDLMRKTKKWGLENTIGFTGWRKDIDKIYTALDVVLLTSVNEGTPVSLIEAMASGKPVIATDVGAVRDLMGKKVKRIADRYWVMENGILVDSQDAEAMALALLHVKEEREVFEEKAKKAKYSVIKRYSTENIINNSTALYLSLGKGDTDKMPQVEYGVPQTVCDLGVRKVLRIISRLNIGGPAIHAFLLTKGLNPQKFITVLVTGRISDYEGDMSYLFDALDNKPKIISELQREISFTKDLKAFLQILKILNQEKPDIVHTHTAKAGTSARFAVFFYSLFCSKDIRTIHTFHGHVFEGYFSTFSSLMFIWIERFLAKITDVIIAISDTQKMELVDKYQIAPSKKIKTKELGFNLKPFLDNKRLKGQFRKRLNIPDDTLLIGIIGRLVPIKNHKMFLNAAKQFIGQNSDLNVKFIIVGDGELRQNLEAYCNNLGLFSYVQFCGWIKDVSIVYSDLDILALTSLNEGTPVSIIEAMASSVPVIATNAGGVVDLVGRSNGDSAKDEFKICERGILSRKNDAFGFSKGLKYLIEIDKKEKKAMLARACNFVKQRYAEDRLIKDIETLYFDMMTDQPKRVSI